MQTGQVPGRIRPRDFMWGICVYNCKKTDAPGS